MSAPRPGPDMREWANQIVRFLDARGLLPRKTNQSAAQDGLLLWDRAGYPVVSIDGTFQRLLTENYMGDIAQAERVVLETYGDTVSVAAKAKNLNKFGNNITVGTSFETVAQFQGTVGNETYVSTNIIDSIVSSNAGDTQTITLEGHTIDGSGNLTFVTQDVTLNGQTEVTLSTPLARANRMFIANSGTFNSPQSAPAGTVYVYDNTDGITSGVPNTAAATKMIIEAGNAQSQKCATSISSTDYWFVTYLDASVGESGGNANRVTVRLEVRDVFNGGVWRPLSRDINLNVGNGGEDILLTPYLIVPKNHDIRIRARADSNTIAIDAEVGGYLAVVQ